MVSLYDRLLELSPTPVVAMNRAIAVAEVDGPLPALALLDQLGLDGYHLFHATRADLLRRAGRTADAASAYARALDLAPGDTERRFLLGELAALPSRDPSRDPSAAT